MKSRPNKTRAITFTALWSLAVVGNVAGAVFNYIVWSRGLLAEGLYQSMLASGWGIYAVAGGAGVFALLVIPAYILSFDPRRRSRPSIRLYVMFAALAASLAGYLLGFSRIGIDNFPLLIGALAAVFVVPLAPLAMERGLGLAKIRAADAVLRAGKPLAALPLVRAGLLFSPSNPAGERVLGLCLAGRGRSAEARPYLDEAYGRGDRAPELLEGLIAAEEAVGNAGRAAELVEELNAVRPQPDALTRLVRLWTASGQEDRALTALQALSAEDRAGWFDIFRDLLVRRGDYEGLRALARESEALDSAPPLARSRTALEPVLAARPDDPAVLAEAADLWERAGDTRTAVDLLERLAAVQTPATPDVLRRLADHYDSQGRRPEALRRRSELVEAGAATLDEKRQVLDDAVARGQSGRAIALVRGDAQLGADPHAASILARELFEAGEADAALEQMTVARSLGLDPNLAAELQGMEQGVRTRRLSHEMTELAASVEANPDDFEQRLNYYNRLVASGAANRVVLGFEDILRRKPELAGRIMDAIQQMVDRHGANFRLLSFLSELKLRERDWDGAFALSEQMAHGSLQPEEVIHESALRVLRGNPGHLPSLLAEARYAAAKGDDEGALSRLDAWIAAGGAATSETRRLELDATARLGRRDRAEGAARALLEAAPEDEELLMRLADIAASEKDWDAALEPMRRTLDINPQRPGLRKRIKDTEELSRRAKVDRLRAQLADAPRDADLREELGDTLHDLGYLDEALVEYQRAAQADSERHLARAKFGYVLARKGMYADAEEALDGAALSPDQPADVQDKIKGVVFRAAELMENEGSEEARALAQFKRVMRVDAEYNGVLKRIERLQHAARKTKRGAI